MKTRGSREPSMSTHSKGGDNSSRAFGRSSKCECLLCGTLSSAENGQEQSRRFEAQSDLKPLERT
jgi:hypothetical protein